jgi:hypothetical protein
VASKLSWRGNPLIRFGVGRTFNVDAGPSCFEDVVKALGLSPNEYEQSAQLKAWVQKNKDHKYVPPDLLQAWNMGIRG